MNNMQFTGRMFRFPSGIRIVLSEPTNFEGKRCVATAMPYIRFGQDNEVRTNIDGTPYVYPGVAYLSTFGITHTVDVYGEADDGFRKIVERPLGFSPSQIAASKKRKPRRRRAKK